MPNFLNSKLRSMYAFMLQDFHNYFIYKLIIHSHLDV